MMRYIAHAKIFELETNSSEKNELNGEWVYDHENISWENTME